MESAIDQRLVCPRTQPRTAAADFQPPYPLWSGRASHELDAYVMGYFGVQYQGAEARPKALNALRHMVEDLRRLDGTSKLDFSQYRDAQGFDHLIASAYWSDPRAHQRWMASPAVSDWWNDPQRLLEGLGYFREILSPRLEQLETLYGSEDLSLAPGVGTIMDRMSGAIQEHGYWGGSRDRLPVAQTDQLTYTGDLGVVEGDPLQRGRVVIRGHGNLTFIRGGQDWSDTLQDERDLYVKQIEPTLRAGMDFLRDHGEEVGCYSNRYVQNIDLDGNPLEHTFAFSFWRSLDHLERWSKLHPTHLRIFGIFMRVANDISKLRLAHEVCVLDAGSQMYEYVGCHAETGLMRDASAGA
jgi:aldoxime dehydratase